MANSAEIARDYDVLTALRGPDHGDAEGAAEWKAIVIAPLRYEVGRALGFSLPHTWCMGAMCHPRLGTPEASAHFNAEIVEAARKFAQTAAAGHVKSHARLAWQRVDYDYYRWLIGQGLF